MKSAYLEYTVPPSCKCYRLSIDATPAGLYSVNFSYGRIGSTQNTGSKLVGAPLANCENVFRSILEEKLAKGYKIVSSDGVLEGDREMAKAKSPAKRSEEPSAYTPVEKKSSGHLPQLLNPITEEEAEAYITDDAYCAQAKYDGRNLTIFKNGVTNGINKLGLVVALPDKVLKDAEKIAVGFVMPSEGIGDDCHAHDLLQLGKEDYRPMGYQKRYKMLAAILNEEPILKHIKLVPVAWTTAEKRAMFDRIKKEGGEGVVFKMKDAPFTVGRPASLGSQLKVKFWHSLTARILAIKPDGKNSIECELLDGKKWVSCGMTTVLKRGLIETLRPNMLCELRYLYALRSSGILYQSSPCMNDNGTFVRDDVDEKDCTVKQLHFRPE
jgi:bifunctional non-homologous end joining protein LigD